MNSKVIQFSKGAVYGALDATLSVYPQTSIIWGALKGGYQAVKHERAQVFVYFVEQNFTPEQFTEEQFVDGIALTFESFMKQRIENKRNVIKNIFLGFTMSEKKENFELERMFDVVTKITPYQMLLLSKMRDKYDTKILEDNSVSEEYSEYKSLESLGLIDIDIHIEIENEEELVGDLEDGSGETGGNQAVLIHDQYANLSLFGEEFIKYILKV